MLFNIVPENVTKAHALYNIQDCLQLLKRGAYRQE